MNVLMNDERKMNEWKMTKWMKNEKVNEWMNEWVKMNDWMENDRKMNEWMENK